MYDHVSIALCGTQGLQIFLDLDLFRILTFYFCFLHSHQWPDHFEEHVQSDWSCRRLKFKLTKPFTPMANMSHSSTLESVFPVSSIFVKFDALDTACILHHLSFSMVMICSQYRLMELTNSNYNILHCGRWMRMSRFPVRPIWTNELF